MKHIPVLLKEVLHVLKPSPDGVFIDGTAGDGGHTEALLQASSPNGQVIALDQDEQQLEVARERLKQFGSRVLFVCARFSTLDTVAKQHNVHRVDGILLDLGYSSRQLADSRYGLDYIRDDAVLDMRLSRSLEASAADFLNHANEQEIADVLFQYGDRHNSRILARKLVQYRRKSRFQVARDVKQALDLWNPKILAPIFQALRIWVNQEYNELETVLPKALALLKPGGTLAVITFHSGEDRLVKHFFKSQHELLQASGLIASPYSEVKQNPRARSAKLRYAVRK